MRYAADSAHVPTAILTELIFSHSDDWSLFPVMARAGNVVRIEKLVVKDCFGREYASTDPQSKGLLPPENWTLFNSAGFTG